jgi:hypothetical protein
MLEGLPLCFSGDLDRRLCTWTQYNSPPRGLIIPELEDKAGRYPTERLGSPGSLGK